jgi:hypothetical protein
MSVGLRSRPENVPESSAAPSATDRTERMGALLVWADVFFHAGWRMSKLE